MNILAFDTTLNKTYISLLINDKIDSKIFETDTKNYHSAYLISGIKEILENNNAKLQNIDLMAVNKGPGSFTGIRVGVTVAKTMAKELNKNVVGINSLDILYKTYENINPDIILDARKEMFYFRNNNKIELIPYNEILNHITKNHIICDTSAIAHLKTLQDKSNDDKYFSKQAPDKDLTLINFEEDNVNLSGSLIKIAKKQFETTGHTDRESFLWHNLNPMYIQPPPIHGR